MNIRNNQQKQTQQSQLQTKQRLKLSNENSNFTVAVRVRPRQISEKKVEISIERETQQILEIGKGMIGTTNRGRKYKFHRVYGQSNDNMNIFNSLIRERLCLLRQGYNLSIMCYGATGSGKTHTIFGQGGLLKESYKFIMKELMQGGSFGLSYLQIYKENVEDLMKEQYNQRQLTVMQDYKGEVVVPGLTRVNIINQNHLNTLVIKGNELRTTGCTDINQGSSRSHAILILQCQYANINTKLTIVDLAGSEKNNYTGPKINRQQLLKQGSSINKSLLSLGSCILALNNKNNHIPYRNSKLTRLLKDNLSGCSHNILIACIDPIFNQLQESISTLNYALKAAQIQQQVLIANNDSIRCHHCEMPVFRDDLINQINFNNTIKRNNRKSSTTKSENKSKTNSKVNVILNDKTQELLKILFKKLNINRTSLKKQEIFTKAVNQWKDTIIVQINKEIEQTKYSSLITTKRENIENKATNISKTRNRTTLTKISNDSQSIQAPNCEQKQNYSQNVTFISPFRVEELIFDTISKDQLKVLKQKTVRNQGNTRIRKKFWNESQNLQNPPITIRMKKDMQQGQIKQIQNTKYKSINQKKIIQLCNFIN